MPTKEIIEKEKVTTENSNKPHGYGKIDIDNFLPFPKNPAIARVFKEIGWAEELGSGIKNINKYSKIYAKSTPLFIENDIFKSIIELKNVYKVLIDSEGYSLIDLEGNMFLVEDDRPPINADKIVEFLRNNEKLLINEVVK